MESGREVCVGRGGKQRRDDVEKDVGQFVLCIHRVFFPADGYLSFCRNDAARYVPVEEIQRLGVTKLGSGPAVVKFTDRCLPVAEGISAQFRVAEKVVEPGVVRIQDCLQPAMEILAPGLVAPEQDVLPRAGLQ